MTQLFREKYINVFKECYACKKENCYNCIKCKGCKKTTKELGSFPGYKGGFCKECFECDTCKNKEKKLHEYCHVHAKCKKCGKDSIHPNRYSAGFDEMCYPCAFDYKDYMEYPESDLIKPEGISFNPYFPLQLGITPREEIVPPSFGNGEEKNN